MKEEALVFWVSYRLQNVSHLTFSVSNNLSYHFLYDSNLEMCLFCSWSKGIALFHDSNLAVSFLQLSVMHTVLL